MAGIDDAPRYSELHPERFGERRAPEFLLPGEDKPRRLGEDPDMPPAAGSHYYERPVNLGFAHLKGSRR